MDDKDKIVLGARIQDLIHDRQVDPQTLLKLARERAERAAAENFTPSQSSLPAIPAELETLGTYELISLLGHGGTGKVYKARDFVNEEIVALKILSPQYLSDEQRLLRFYMEAEAASSLSHPNIVHIHHVADERGYHYMVMDYVEGIELSDLVEDKPLTPDTAARILMLITEVMEYVHRQGILHRDLKPANVMIDTNGKLWVTDFGIAKLQSGPSNVTTTGMLLGTPSYMPPEQVDGNSDSLGPTCDIYSLGAMLYELLTGEPPFQGDSPYETLQKVLSTQPKPLRQHNPSIPKALESICLKCLEKDPSKRYASAGDLAEDLKSFLTGTSVQASGLGSGMLRNALDAAAAPPSHHGDPEIMARWGRILRWHAFLWLSLCLSSQFILWGNVEGKLSLMLLWGFGGVSLLSVFLSYRFYRYKPLTPVEKQAFGLMFVFLLGLGAFVCGKLFLPITPIDPWQQILSTGFVVTAIAFGALCVVVDGSFFVLALAFLGLPYAFAQWPNFTLMILGLALAVGFYIPGRRFERF